MRYLLLALALVACGKPAAPKKYGSFVGPGFVHSDRDTLATLGNSAVAGDVAQYNGTAWTAVLAGNAMSGSAAIGTTSANTLTVNATVNATPGVGIGTAPGTYTLDVEAGASDSALRVRAHSDGRSITFDANGVVINTALAVTGGIKVGGLSGPSWTSGAGAPTGACTNGSLYSNTSGASGSTFYTCVSTAWVDVK